MRFLSLTRAKSCSITLTVLLSALFTIAAIGGPNQLGKNGNSQGVSVQNNSVSAQNSARVTSNPQLVARGKYIVEDVAICTQCHTPHTNSGELDRSRWLEGAALWLQPAAPDPNWPLRAPRLAGSPPGSDADLISLLTTGQWRGGERLRPPMPQFRMSTEDAQAVVAYLRSLSPPVGREP
jgi:mono/diheme cytochrome c family protein